MKINIFWGELTDISAKKEALVAMLSFQEFFQTGSALIGWVLKTVASIYAGAFSFLSVPVVSCSSRLFCEDDC